MGITGAQYLAGAWQAYGVDTVFFVPTILSKTLYELEQTTAIRRVVTHGEKAAAYMADGYARASGRLGVCMAQTVGAANLAAGLRDPYLANSPVLAITGGPYPWSRHRMQYQEIEDFALFAQVTKLSAHVPEPARLPALMAHAVRTAVSGKPGPVHLEFPGHTGELVEDGTIDASIPDGPIRAPRFRVHPDPEAVTAALDRLAAAQRPVIVSGGGVRVSGAEKELLELAERLDIPLATSLNGKDTVPSNHRLSIGVPGLYSRASANHIILEADLVFFVGSQTGSQVTLNWSVPPPSTSIIHLDIEPTELGRHYEDELQILGDAKVTLQAMLSALSGRARISEHSAWLDRCRNLRERWRADVDNLMTSDDVPMRPERLMRELTRTLPSDALVVIDTGHAGLWTGGYLDLEHPEQGFIRAAGSLGWALPASLGAKLANPDRPVVLFTGDGGFWYHVAELETAARWNIGTVMVVNNNRSLNQEINPYSVAYGGQLHGRHHELWHFNDVDFTAVADALGVKSYRVEKPQELAGILERAFADSGPVVVDVVTDLEIVAPKGSSRVAAR